MNRIAGLLAIQLALLQVIGGSAGAFDVARLGTRSVDNAVVRVQATGSPRSAIDTLFLSESPSGWMKVEVQSNTSIYARNPSQLIRTVFPLTWTSPGDDGLTGQATKYDIRYSRIPISTSSWELATKLTTKTVPQPAGATQHLRVIGLPAGERFYFALKSADECMNWSAISNIKSDSAVTEVAICGDADANGMLTISDASALGAYIFAEGPAPIPLLVADMDGNGIISISDVVYFINYVFFSGPSPRCSE